MKPLSIILTIILGIAGFSASANESPVTMQIPNSEVCVGEVFQIVYQVVSHTETVPSITVTSPKGCTLLAEAEPQSEVRYSRDPWVNTDYLRYSRYVYTYRADKAGRYTVNPATTKLGKYKFKSNSGLITVTDTDNSTPAQGDIFMKLDLSSQHAAVGEPVTLSVLLFSRWMLDDYTAYRYPAAKNCNIERVPTGPERIGEEVIDGTVYGVWIIERYVLTPTHTGKIKINPGCYGIAPDYSGNADPFFFSRPRVQRRFAFTPAGVTLDVEKSTLKDSRPSERLKTEKQPGVNREPDENIIYVMTDDMSRHVSPIII